MSPVRVAVIGAGRWGPNLIRNFHSGSRSLVTAVCDSSETRLNLIRNRYADIACIKDVRDIFKRDDNDAIVICTPTATHFELAREALKNGKHVFVEKPLATTSAQCAELSALATARTKVLFVGHIFLFNAGIQAVKRWIDNGSLGRIHYVQMTRTNLGPVRQDVSALWDLAPHDLSILKYWFDRMPESVSAVGGRFLNDQLEDTVFATYRFSNNLLANLHVSWLNPKKVREIVIVGENKMLIWDDMDLSHPVKIFDKRVTLDRIKDEEAWVDTFVSFRASIHEGDTLIPKIAVNEPLDAECQDFLNAIEGQSTIVSDGPFGEQVVSALEATDQSAQAGGRETPITYRLAQGGK